MEEKLISKENATIEEKEKLKNEIEQLKIENVKSGKESGEKELIIRTILKEKKSNIDENTLTKVNRKEQ